MSESRKTRRTMARYARRAEELGWDVRDTGRGWVISKGGQTLNIPSTPSHGRQMDNAIAPLRKAGITLSGAGVTVEKASDQGDTALRAAWREAEQKRAADEARQAQADADPGDDPGDKPASRTAKWDRARREMREACEIVDSPPKGWEKVTTLLAQYGLPDSGVPTMLFDHRLVKGVERGTKGGATWYADPHEFATTRWLTTAQASKVAHITPRAISAAAAADILPCEWSSNQRWRRYSISDVLRYAADLVANVPSGRGRGEPTRQSEYLDGVVEATKERREVEEPPAKPGPVVQAATRLAAAPEVHKDFLATVVGRIGDDVLANDEGGGLWAIQPWVADGSYPPLAVGDVFAGEVVLDQVVGGIKVVVVEDIDGRPWSIKTVTYKVGAA